MTADEARKLSETISSEKEKDQYADILSGVRISAGLGLFATTVDYSLLPAVVKRLKDDGFTVNGYSDRDGISTTVSWAK